MELPRTNPLSDWLHAKFKTVTCNRELVCYDEFPEDFRKPGTTAPVISSIGLCEIPTSTQKGNHKLRYDTAEGSSASFSI